MAGDVGEARNFPGASVRKALRNWFLQSGRALPWRTNLEPYSVLVSEFMCQQTTVAAVIPYYERWMKRWPDIESLAKADESEVLSAWEGLGYYSRCRNLLEAAQVVLTDHKGRIPDVFDDLRKLPGVGDYTANAVLAFAFDRRVPVVDANVTRVVSRIFDIRVPVDTAEGRDRVSQATAMIIGGEARGRSGGRMLASALMELGALICTPKNPRCSECPVRGACRTEDPPALPRKKPRPVITKVVEKKAWIADESGVHLTRMSGTRWKGMWGLPEASTERDGDAIVCQETYPITRYLVTMDVLRESPREGLRFVPWNEVETVAIPSPHRRVIRKLAGKL